MSEKDIKILFMGTPDIAAYVLENLIDYGYNIVGVVAQMDKPVGRKKIVQEVPTKVVAKMHNIPVYQPQKIKLDYEFVKEINPDLILTLAYGQIVPQALLDIPKYGCLNLHGSLLPKYRGAAPMQYALINGDKKTGISLMEMIDKMDAGKVYATKEVLIEEDDTYATLKDKMKKCAFEIILENLQKYLDGALKGIIQDEELVTFSPSIKKEEEHINFDLPSQTIINWMRALNDKPGLYGYIDGQVVKFWKGKVVSNQIIGKIGEIVKADNNGLLMQAKDGLIAILELQKEGKKLMDYKSFINGNRGLLGKIIS